MGLACETNTNRACSFHANKGESGCISGLFAACYKAVSCAVSDEKADRVQGGVATNRVRREISVSVATNGSFLVNRFVTFLHLENDTATSEKYPSRVL